MDYIGIEPVNFGNRAKNILITLRDINEAGINIKDDSDELKEKAMVLFGVLKGSATIPEDCQIHAFGWDYMRQIFYMTISSNSFDETPQGAMLPSENIDLSKLKEAAVADNKH